MLISKPPVMTVAEFIARTSDVRFPSIQRRFTDPVPTLVRYSAPQAMVEKTVFDVLYNAHRPWEAAHIAIETLPATKQGQYDLLAGAIWEDMLGTLHVADAAHSSKTYALLNELHRIILRYPSPCGRFCADVEGGGTVALSPEYGIMFRSHEYFRYDTLPLIPSEYHLPILDAVIAAIPLYVEKSVEMFEKRRLAAEARRVLDQEEDRIADSRRKSATAAMSLLEEKQNG